MVSLEILSEPLNAQDALAQLLVLDDLCHWPLGRLHLQERHLEG